MQCLLGETSTNETGVYTADDFAAFFEDKVDAVRTSTTATPSYDVPFKAMTSTLGSWTAVTVDEVEKLIASALNKTCQLNPAPTWLVKEMRGLLAPFVLCCSTSSLIPAVFQLSLSRLPFVRF